MPPLYHSAPPRPSASPLPPPPAARPSTHEPQPRNAAAFRAIASARLAQRLTNNSSRWKLNPVGSNTIADIVGELARTKAQAIPSNTERANDNGIRWFSRACASLGTPIDRPSPAEADPENEIFLHAYVVYYAALNMRPAERTATTRAGIVKDRANPNSAAGALYGARRVLEDAGAYLPPMKEVVKVLKGLRRRMVEDFGDDALAPQQAQPWSSDELARMLTALDSASVPGWSPERHRSMADTLVFANNVGCRKAEIPRYKRANVTWFDAQKREVPLTQGFWLSLGEGCWVRIVPVASKTDQDNTTWGATEMWFKVRLGDPWSVAARLLRLERDRPCPASERPRTPMLADPSSTPPLPHQPTRLTAWLNQLMDSVGISPTRALLLRWHSARVTLACRLRAKKMPWDRIQSFLRWKSADSARVYGRLHAEDYDSDIHAALAVDGTGISVADLPELEPTGALATIDDAIASETSTAKSEATQAKASAKPTHAHAAANARSAAPVKRARPAAAAPTPPPVPAPPAPPNGKWLSFDVGRARHMLGCTADSWGLTGNTLKIPHAAWRATAHGASLCTVVAVTAAPTCPIIVLAADGHHYSISPELALSSATTTLRTKLRKAARGSPAPLPLLSPPPPTPPSKRRRPAPTASAAHA